MNDYNKKMSEQLGMAHGTAQYRLNRLILFEFVHRLGLSGCFQCGKTIETLEELSIEHKIPWLDSDNPAGLFFDLNNIAFSHLKCNQHESRVVRLLGERNYNSKLTKEAVKEIRSSNQSVKSLAEKFGVSISTIYLVRTGKTWKHVKK